MQSLRVKFRIEKTDHTTCSNCLIYADINCKGRTKGYVGLFIYDLSDFDTIKQKFTPGKKVQNGSFDISSTQANGILDNYKSKLYAAYNKLVAIGDPFTVHQIKYTAFPELQSRRKSNQKDEFNTVSYIKQMADKWFGKKIIGPERKSQYYKLSDRIYRFSHFHYPFNIKTATADQIADLMEFIRTEFAYVIEHPDFYKDMQRKPKAAKEVNTMAAQMKMLNSLYEDMGMHNPAKNGSKLDKVQITEVYNEAIYLEIQEFLRLLAFDCPQELLFCRDSFIVQCTIGARVADYWKIASMPVLQNTAGINYIRYAPNKTNIRSEKIEVIETPLIKCSVDIIRKYGMVMPIKNYKKHEVSTLYNMQIRQILEMLGIDRPVVIRENDQLVSVPLYTQASSKLARKTFVDITTKAQLNPYISGLHKEGSKAVRSYTSMTLEDKYRFNSMAFRQEI